MLLVKNSLYIVIATEVMAGVCHITAIGTHTTTVAHATTVVIIARVVTVISLIP